jgi:hypothetical protein
LCWKDSRTAENAEYAQAGVAEAGRAVAARNVRVPHAALNRCVQKSWFDIEAYPVDWRAAGAMLRCRSQR